MCIWREVGVEAEGGAGGQEQVQWRKLTALLQSAGTSVQLILMCRCGIKSCQAPCDWLHKANATHVRRAQVQLSKLTASFQSVSEDLRRRFVVDGEPLLDPDSIGSSPVFASSLRRTTGFAVTQRPLTMASSGAPPAACLHAMSGSGAEGKVSAQCSSVHLFALRQLYSRYP